MANGRDVAAPFLDLFGALQQNPTVLALQRLREAGASGPQTFGPTVGGVAGSGGGQDLAEPKSIKVDFNVPQRPPKETAYEPGVETLSSRTLREQASRLENLMTPGAEVEGFKKPPGDKLVPGAGFFQSLFRPRKAAERRDIASLRRGGPLRVATLGDLAAIQSKLDRRGAIDEYKRAVAERNKFFDQAMAERLSVGDLAGADMIHRFRQQESFEPLLRVGQAGTRLDLDIANAQDKSDLAWRRLGLDASKEERERLAQRQDNMRMLLDQSKSLEEVRADLAGLHPDLLEGYIALKAQGVLYPQDEQQRMIFAAANAHRAQGKSIEEMMGHLVRISGIARDNKLKGAALKPLQQLGQSLARYIALQAPERAASMLTGMSPLLSPEQVRQIIKEARGMEPIGAETSPTPGSFAAMESAGEDMQRLMQFGPALLLWRLFHQGRGEGGEGGGGVGGGRPGTPSTPESMGRP